MKLGYEAFTTFLLCSYCVGWCINGLRARQTGFIDLCQFVQAYLLAPFVVLLAFVVMVLIKIAIIPHLLEVITSVVFVVGSISAFAAFGYFVITPSVKKAYGIAKPFSKKICIVMYREKDER